MIKILFFQNLKMKNLKAMQNEKSLNDKNYNHWIKIDKRKEKS